MSQFKNTHSLFLHFFVWVILFLCALPVNASLFISALKYTKAAVADIDALEGLPISHIVNLKNIRLKDIQILEVNYPQYDAKFNKLNGSLELVGTLEPVQQYKCYRFNNKCDDDLCLTLLVKIYGQEPKLMGAHMLGSDVKQISGSPKPRDLRKMLAFDDRSSIESKQTQFLFFKEGYKVR